MTCTCASFVRGLAWFADTICVCRLSVSLLCARQIVSSANLWPTLDRWRKIAGLENLGGSSEGSDPKSFFTVDSTEEYELSQKREGELAHEERKDNKLTEQASTTCLFLPSLPLHRIPTLAFIA